MVWDPNNEGRIMWRDVTSITGTGGADHDWYNQATLTNITTSVNDDIYTFGNVFVNIPTAQFGLFYFIKFGVTQDAGGFNQSGAPVSISGGFRNIFAHQLVGSREYGVYAEAIGDGCTGFNPDLATYNYGGYFKAIKAVYNYAGYFESDCSCTNVYNYGVYSVVPEDCGSAGFFEGNVEITGNQKKLSDARFKTNINTLTNGLDIIEQLNPVSFYFSAPVGTNLPTGIQYGLIAQEVEPIIPNSTSTGVISAKFDTLGNMISDTINFKALNYNVFIPYLIKATQELNDQNIDLQNQVDSLETIISTYETRFQQLEDMIATCCASNKSGQVQETDVNSVIEINPDKSLYDNSVLYQNNPNPFNYKTTFNYKIGVDGFIELEIHDQYGNFITSLVSKNQTAGSYSVEWNAQDIAPGVYFYSLKINGVTWVKKAIKVR